VNRKCKKLLGKTKCRVKKIGDRKVRRKKQKQKVNMPENAKTFKHTFTHNEREKEIV
jgi:hypothetical protein